MYNEVTEAVPSIHNETTEAVPSINSEVTEAVPSVSEEDTLTTPSVSEQPEAVGSEIIEEAPLDELEWLDIIAAEETLQETAIVAPEQSTNMPSPTPIAQNEQETQPAEVFPVVAQDVMEPQTDANTSVITLPDENEEQSNTEHPEVQTVQEEQRLPSTEEHTFVDDPYEDADASALQDLQYEREPQSDFRTDDFADINQDISVEEYTPNEEQTEEVPEKDVAMNSSAQALYTAKTTKAMNPGKSRSKNRHKGRK
jgi:hypothetical protein